MGRTRSSVLAALLTFALIVTALVTYRAYVSSRQEKTVVQQVLQNYVAFGAMKLQEGFVTGANSCMRMWLGPLTRESRSPSVGDLPFTGCGADDALRFDLDLAAKTPASADSRITQSQLNDLLRRIPADTGLALAGAWSVGLMATPSLGHDAVAIYALKRQNGRAVRAAGFVSAHVAPWILRRVLDDVRLLPPNLSRGARNDTLFETRLLRQAPLDADTWLTSTAPTAFPGLWLQVELRPSAINVLVPGGVPDDRGLELIALFVLGLGLVAASLLLIRREAELARAQAGFVSSVSHELRTPLAQIRMFAEMLLLGRVRTEKDRTRSLEIIDKEARRLSQLVENVLQVARTARTTARVTPAETHLAPVIRETVESFMVLAEARQVEFRLELQENLVVSADTEAVRQIVLNLLDNAAKYGPVGQRVTVGFALFGTAARLWIDDEGPGVPVRERERVFEAFYRARRDLESNVTGSGIGLGVVRELAALHGGSAWITDAPQHGTRAVVEFPRARMDAEQKSDDWAVA